MLVEKVLVESVQLTTTVAVYYTTSVKVHAVIGQATLCNPTSGAVTATIYLIPPGASPGVSNAIIWQQSIPAGQTAILAPMVNHGLVPAGSSIQALASAAASLTFRISGYERAVS